MDGIERKRSIFLYVTSLFCFLLDRVCGQTMGYKYKAMSMRKIMSALQQEGS